ncbi:MAG: ATP-binding protein, partial [Myxococcota bacterium]|nr:ATP-binding protein [Myxococcota bacterium]
MLVQISEKKQRAQTPSPAEPVPLSEAALAPGREIERLAWDAIQRFKLLAPGDRVAVAISGGKDSLLLLRLFQRWARRGDLDFQWRAIHLDQRQPGFDHAALHRACEALGAELTVISRDTWSVVEEKRRPGQIPCAICARLRRGILNRWCAEEGYNKLALGHHLDDAAETFFLNLLYGQRLAPLKAATPASEHPVTTIRPLLLVEERRIRAWATRSGLAPVDCPVCDSFPDAKRR